MSSGRRLTTAGVFIMISAGSAAFAGQPAAQILRHQSIAITSHKKGTLQRISFDAFGKRFNVVLEPNERVNPALPASTSGIEPLRGAIEGIPQSWARLTRSGDGRWQGLLFDGSDVYAIEAASNVASMTAQPLEKSSATPVMFRLADMVVQWDAGFCETVAPGEKTTALDAYKALGVEMQSVTAASAPTKQIAVGVVTDYEFSSYFTASGTTATQAVIERMNIVDGIFSSQVGIAVSVPTVTVYSSESDPFTAYEAKDLLAEAHTFRKGNSEHMSRGLTHLMTGRDLTGDTVGIAYVGSLCGEWAASLSEGASSTTLAALIAAHEIGHNFNAPHDGEGACASTPLLYLMAPQLNGSSEFSACSLEQMQPSIALASCLSTYTSPDASLQLSATTVQSVINTATAVSFSVTTSGGESSQDVIATATLPDGLTLNSSTATEGTCSAEASTVTCTFSTLQAGVTQAVRLSITAATTGTFPVDIAVSSSNDSVTTNNTGQMSVVISETAAQSSPVSSSDGGGGGALSYGLLSMLAALSLRRTVRQIRPQTSM